MTEENFNYRTSSLFLRNEFDSNEDWDMPVISNPNIELERDIRVIGFDRIKNDKDNHYNRLVHFFLYDYEFEDIWKNPAKYVETLKKYKGVLSPDFSMYIEMNPVLQLYNTFRNRWVGAFLSKNGINVIPTVNWGLENTFDFCFNGIEKGSIVAVSTYMVSEHGNHSDQKDFFLKGYNEMLKRIEPKLILCYHTPFPEMQGNILYVDYELSSWRHYEDDACKEYGNNSTNIIKYHSGYILSDANKGMGSAFGGRWKPRKPEDERFLGEPGEIKITTITTRKNTYIVYTKIGEDGRAILERHFTDHGYLKHHSNPHDHIIDWSRGVPDFNSTPIINYFDGDVPEFKKYKEKDNMKISMLTIISDPDSNRFTSISDFKQCMSQGGEVEFDWKGKGYSITHKDKKILIGEGHYFDENGVAHNVADDEIVETSLDNFYDTSDEALEHIVGTDRLRDIITEIEVIYRTI